MDEASGSTCTCSGAAMTMMKVGDVAKRLNCSPSLVYALIESGRLKCHVIGNGRQGGKRVSEEQLQEYLRGTEKGGEARAPGKPPAKPIKLRHLEV